MKPTVHLNIINETDEDGVNVDVARFYQIEIRVNGLCTTSSWYSAEDKNLDEIVSNIASSINGSWDRELKMSSDKWCLESEK